MFAHPMSLEGESSSRRLHAKRLVAFFLVAESQGPWDGFLASDWPMNWVGWGLCVRVHRPDPVLAES